MLSKVSSVEKICKPIHIDTAVNLFYQCSVNAVLHYYFWETDIRLIHTNLLQQQPNCMYVPNPAHQFTFTFSVFCCFLHNVCIILTIFHFWVVPPTLTIEGITPTWTLEWHAENVGQIYVRCKECCQWEPWDEWRG